MNIKIRSPIVGKKKWIFGLLMNSHIYLNKLRIFSQVDQSPDMSILTSLSNIIKALISDELLKQPNFAYTATCHSEIFYIMALDTPYSNEIIHDTFPSIISSFASLIDKSIDFYTKRLEFLRLQLTWEDDGSKQCIVSHIVITPIIILLNIDIVDELLLALPLKSNIPPLRSHLYSILVFSLLHDTSRVTTLFFKVIVRLHTFPIDIRLLSTIAGIWC